MSTFTPSAEQAAIIDAPVDADVLVVAGAGSGKTFTMTQRIIALINRGVAPERILGLTFTRKAAGELLERVSAAVAGDMAGSTTATVSDRAFLKPAIFTYDAFFQTIVKECDLGQLISLVSCIYHRREDLIAAGKKLGASDETLLQRAEALIENEVAYVLKVEQSEVSDYIRDKLAEAITA